MTGYYPVNARRVEVSVLSATAGAGKPAFMTLGSTSLGLDCFYNYAIPDGGYSPVNINVQTSGPTFQFAVQQATGTAAGNVFMSVTGWEY
jgi:hypothetical protein